MPTSWMTRTPLAAPQPVSHGSKAQSQQHHASAHGLILTPISQGFVGRSTLERLRKGYIAPGQVCRQMRQEYRSLNAATESFVAVYMQDLQHYIDLVYPSRELVVMAGYRGTILVLAYAVTKEMYDILPLMELLRGRPGLTCVFQEFHAERKGWYPVSGINKALLAAEKSLSAVLLSEAICPVDRVMFRGAVIYDCASEPPELAIWFKKEYAPVWLAGDVKSEKWNWFEQQVSSTFPQASLDRALQIRHWLKNAGMVEMCYVDWWDVVLDVTQD